MEGERGERHVSHHVSSGSGLIFFLAVPGHIIIIIIILIVIQDTDSSESQDIVRVVKIAVYVRHSNLRL